jgi:rhodanese-related sulfurtransferase
MAAAMQALKSNAAVLVDVREPSEWTSGVAHQAALLPLSDLAGARQQWQNFLAKHRTKKILLYCHSGSRSGQAAAQLRREGYDAINTGSLQTWRQARWPINLPRPAQ